MVEVWKARGRIGVGVHCRKERRGLCVVFVVVRFLVLHALSALKTRVLQLAWTYLLDACDGSILSANLLVASSMAADRLSEG